MLTQVVLRNTKPHTYFIFFVFPKDRVSKSVEESLQVRLNEEIDCEQHNARYSEADHFPTSACIVDRESRRPIVAFCRGVAVLAI